MSRSRRYTHHFGGADSAKDEKRICNQAERSRVRDAIASERYDDILSPPRTSIAWEGSKELRFYHSPWENECFCRPAGWYRASSPAYECWYCREGGYQEWLKRRMRK